MNSGGPDEACGPSGNPPMTAKELVDTAIRNNRDCADKALVMTRELRQRLIGHREDKLSLPSEEGPDVPPGWLGETASNVASANEVILAVM